MDSSLFDSIFTNVWSIALVILFFGGSIFVHELGHFLAAKKRGLKVTRFSIGFGPRIFGWRGRDGVEYRLSWLPLGGYVALPQLADMRAIEGDEGHEPPQESVATANDVRAVEEEPGSARQLPEISYSSKMIVFAAGAFFNVLFAFALACIIWVVGIQVAAEEQTTRIGIARPTIEAADGRTVPGPAFAAGLRVDDVIVAVDGRSVESFSDILQHIALGSGRNQEGRPQVRISYERNGQRADAFVLPELSGPEKIREIGVEPVVRTTVAGLQTGSAADEAGVKPGDIITHLDGEPVHYTSFISDRLKQTGARPVRLAIDRAGQPVEITATPRRTTDSATGAEVFRLGVQLSGAFTLKTIHPTPWKQIGDQILLSWRSLVSLVNPRSDVGISNMVGPVGIVRIFDSAAKSEGGIRTVLVFTVLINISLAIFNLLPIPVLDGGHMMFATIGKLRGRPLPVNFVMTTQSVFMVLLLSMIIYVTAFDFRRWHRDSQADEPAPAAPATPAAPAPSGK